MTVPDSLLTPSLTAEAVTGEPLAAATIPVGSFPRFLAVTPDESQVYVPIANPSNTVLVIDATTNTVVRNPITFGANPFVAAVAPDGSHVYVTNVDSSTLSVIDTSHQRGGCHDPGRRNTGLSGSDPRREPRLRGKSRLEHGIGDRHHHQHSGCNDPGWKLSPSFGGEVCLTQRHTPAVN